MSEIEPYTVLGVSRTATREEIARAYRRLAKEHHPDAGAPASPTMARVNEAWSVLSDTARRARWDREHARPAVPPAWTLPPPRAAASPPRPAVPATTRDSPWFAAGVVAFAALLVGGVMIGLNLATASAEQPAALVAAPGFTLILADDWEWIEGDGTDPDGHRVLAHMVTFPVTDEERCTSFSAACPLDIDEVPPGQASVVITAWSGGPPPVPDPVVARPFGLDADRIIGGEPAAFELQRVGSGAVAWWQLSPPGFPDRWIEVRADIGGQLPEQDARIVEIDAMLATLEFSAPD